LDADESFQKTRFYHLSNGLVCNWARVKVGRRSTIWFVAAVLTFVAMVQDSPHFKPDSQIMVSLTELDPNGQPKLGPASMVVLNVVPSNGAVDVRVHIQWEDNIPFRVNMIVLN
jgi:hypothetical protein